VLAADGVLEGRDGARGAQAVPSSLAEMPEFGALRPAHRGDGDPRGGRAAASPVPTGPAEDGGSLAAFPVEGAGPLARPTGVDEPDGRGPEELISSPTDEGPVGTAVKRGPVPDADLPTVRAPEVRAPDVEAPNVNSPRVNVPEVRVERPTADLGDGVGVPSVETPSVPSVDAPDVSVPSVDVPAGSGDRVSVPQTNSGAVQLDAPSSSSTGGSAGGGGLPE